MPTKDECKRLLSQIGWKLGISPRRISEKLLSLDDKQDMLNGNLPMDALLLHVKTWMTSGAHNLVLGNDKENP